MLACKGLENYSRVGAEEEMALSVPCTWMTGHMGTPAERVVQREEVIKPRRLAWNQNKIAKAKSLGNH